MRVSIDSAGRVVIPKSVRDRLGFSPERPVELEVLADRLELTVQHESTSVIEGPNGPVIGATGKALTDADVRSALEAIREGR